MILFSILLLSFNVVVYRILINIYMVFGYQIPSSIIHAVFTYLFITLLHAFRQLNYTPKVMHEIYTSELYVYVSNLRYTNIYILK